MRTGFSARRFMIQILNYRSQYHHLLLDQTIDDIISHVGTSASDQVLVHKLEYLSG